MPPLPSPPRTYLIGAFAAFLVLIWIAAQFFGGDRTSSHFFHDALTAAAGTAFALAGFGEVLRRWQESARRRRTQPLAWDLLDQAMHQTALIAAQALNVLGQPTLIGQVEYAAQLPFTPTRKETFARQTEVANAVLGPLFESFSPEGPSSNEAKVSADQMIARAVRAGPELEPLADKLRALASELGPHVGDDDAIRLLTDVAALHQSVRSLIGPLPGYRDVPRALGALFGGLNATDVLPNTQAVAEALGEQYDDLFGDLGPIEADDLRTTVEAAQQRADEEDRHAQEEHAMELELAELEREQEHAQREMQESFANMQSVLEEIRDDPIALRQLREGLSEVAQQLRDVKTELSGAETAIEPKDQRLPASSDGEDEPLPGTTA
jgi:hypothetical protein